MGFKGPCMCETSLTNRESQYVDQSHLSLHAGALKSACEMLDIDILAEVQDVEGNSDRQSFNVSDTNREGQSSLITSAHPCQAVFVRSSA